MEGRWKFAVEKLIDSLRSRYRCTFSQEFKAPKVSHEKVIARWINDLVESLQSSSVDEMGFIQASLRGLGVRYEKIMVRDCYLEMAELVADEKQSSLTIGHRKLHVPRFHHVSFCQGRKCPIFFKSKRLFRILL